MANPISGQDEHGAADPRPAGGNTSGPPLHSYEVLACVCGGIAAYKTAALVSALVQTGCGVSVAMTRSARRLVGEATFRALSGRPVFTSMWRGGVPHGMPHLSLGELADLAVVAPATANIIGKLAGGIANDLVSTLLLSADCPVMLAPAMNARMWQHPAVQRNVAWLREAGCLLVGPEEGRLACAEDGPGRMAEPKALLEAIQQQLLRSPPKQAAKPRTGTS